MSVLVLASWSFGVAGSTAALALLGNDGSAFDAVVVGATAVEDGESADSTGAGGAPDADGNVSLDVCVMTDPSHCGSVACVRHYPNPTAIARRVMEQTIHVTLVGRGAEEFAARRGFESRSPVTEAARTRWVKWRDEIHRSGHSPHKG